MRFSSGGPARGQWSVAKSQGRRSISQLHRLPPRPLVGAFESAASTIRRLYSVSLQLFPMICDDFAGIDSLSVGGNRPLLGNLIGNAYVEFSVKKIALNGNYRPSVIGSHFARGLEFLLALFFPAGSPKMAIAVAFAWCICIRARGLEGMYVDVRRLKSRTATHTKSGGERET
jgi:hypothetical protein